MALTSVPLFFFIDEGTYRLAERSSARKVTMESAPATPETARRPISKQSLRRANEKYYSLAVMVRAILTYMDELHQQESASSDPEEKARRRREFVSIRTTANHNLVRMNNILQELCTDVAAAMELD